MVDCACPALKVKIAKQLEDQTTVSRLSILKHSEQNTATQDHLMGARWGARVGLVKLLGVGLAEKKTALARLGRWFVQSLITRPEGTITCLREKVQKSKISSPMIAIEIALILRPFTTWSIERKIIDIVTIPGTSPLRLRLIFKRSPKIIMLTISEIGWRTSKSARDFYTSRKR